MDHRHVSEGCKISDEVAAAARSETGGNSRSVITSQEFARINKMRLQHMMDFTALFFFIFPLILGVNRIIGVQMRAGCRIKVWKATRSLTVLYQSHSVTCSRAMCRYSVIFVRTIQIVRPTVEMDNLAGKRKQWESQDIFSNRGHFWKALTLSGG